MALLAAAALHAQNIIYVSASGLGVEPYDTLNRAATTLSAAVDYAKGQYEKTGVRPRIKLVGTVVNQDATELSNVEIFGDGWDNANLSVTTSGATMNIGENVLLHGLLFTRNGSIEIKGAPYKMTGESSVISNCHFKGIFRKTATYGEELAGNADAGLITHCLFTGISSNNGGHETSNSNIGIGHLHLSGSARMVNSVFTGNYHLGNARGPIDGTISIRDSAVLENCVIYGNYIKATAAGDSESSGSYRPRRGAGVFVRGGSPTIRNCIIRNNKMPKPYMEEPGETDIYSATEEADIYIYPGATPVIENCNIPEGQVPECAVGCQSADPRFTDPDNETVSARDFSVAADSPCVDAGRTARWMIGATDYTGVTPRYQGQGADIGAFEVAQSETPLKAYIELGGTTRAEKYATAEMSAFLIGPNQSGGGVFTWYTSAPQSGSPSPIAQGNPAGYRFTEGTWTVYLKAENADGAGKSVYASLTDAVVVSRGADYYVKADGYDANSGDIDAPFATVEHAVAAASLIATPERRARIKIVGTVSAVSAGVSLENMELYGDSREDCVFKGPPSGTYQNAKITMNGNSLLHTLKLYDWRGKGVLTLNSDSACVSNVWAASLRYSTRGTPALNATAGLVTHCLFTSCKCNYGQVFSLNGTAKMRNSILTGNYISIDADAEAEVSNGLFNIADSAELENNTIYSNYASKRAVNDQLCAGVEVVSGSPRIRNNIVRNNRINGNIETGTICNYIVQEGANPIVSNNNSDEGFGSNAQSADPKFADPDNATVSARDFSIAEDSPCIDAGRGISWRRNSVDYAGNPRIQGRRVDIGAYEYNSGVVNWGIFLRMR